jgi:RimJ/RimL family protein N-acetyltransferase
MSQVPYVSIDTSRLLVRSVQQWETKEYGIINGLQRDENHEITWAGVVQDWKKKGAILLFIILINGQGADGLSVGEGAVVGIIQICAEKDGKSEITGLRTHPDFLQQGYMTEALTAVINHAFYVLGQGVLFLKTKPNNNAVIRMMKRLGLDHCASPIGAWKGYTFDKDTWEKYGVGG